MYANIYVKDGWLSTTHSFLECRMWKCQRDANITYSTPSPLCQTFNQKFWLQPIDLDFFSPSADSPMVDTTVPPHNDPQMRLGKLMFCRCLSFLVDCSSSDPLQGVYVGKSFSHLPSKVKSTFRPIYIVGRCWKCFFLTYEGSYAYFSIRILTTRIQKRNHQSNLSNLVIFYSDLWIPYLKWSSLNHQRITTYKISIQTIVIGVLAKEGPSKGTNREPFFRVC